MRYEGAVYRPPSEAGSLIVQLTIGCARNTCTFCSMYKEKKFRVRDLDEVIEDFYIAKRYYTFGVRRLFLADGDALVVKTEDLLYILNKANELFGETLERITMYGAPKDVLLKSDEELKALKDAGLYMVYIGAESGDDEVLKEVKKGATAEEISEAVKKLKKAGILVSMTLISGLGGRKRKVEHALNSARLVTESKPDYVGFLTLMVEEGTEMLDKLRRGEMELLTPPEVLNELKMFIENVDSEGTVFRSNHASNYLSLGGTFNRDKEELLEIINRTIEKRNYKPEYWRGL
ncbi:MAG: radical SAM protein [Lachnospiraceae bacterium]|nr:radical SAM protein [Lachnospiraceae bacterium]